jgi:type IV secretion system protein VirD4
MTDDPLRRLTNLPLDWSGGRSNGNGLGLGLNDALTVARGANALGRRMAAAQVRRQVLAAGYDPITADAAAEAVKAGRDPGPILVAADRANAVRRQQADLLANPPPIHGAARWAAAADLATAGLLQANDPGTGPGLLLGRHGADHLYWKGESHLLTVAPTRTGKATMQIIPNLLRYQGSAVVLDPKGELAAATAAWRAKHVGPVYLLNPFDLPPYDLPAAAFNPLDHVRDERDATKLAELIYPRVDDDRHRFFDNEAIGFLSAVILFTAREARPGFDNLGNIRDSVSALDDRFYQLLDGMTAHDLSPSIRNAASNVLTKTSDTSQPRLIDSLAQHLRIWDTPGLRRSTAHSDFDFRQLKDEAATVYLLLPFEELKAYSTYVQLVFGTALDAMLTNPRRPHTPVLFVLDEFLALDANDRFVDALRTHAGAGARLWFFLQDLATLEQKYPTTWKSFLQAECKTFFGTDDPHTAELISRYLGDTTVAYETFNGSTSVAGGGASYSVSDGVQLSGRPLLKPDEVIRLLARPGASEPRPALHFLRGVPPVEATLTPWFKDPLSVERMRETADA